MKSTMLKISSSGDAYEYANAYLSEVIIGSGNGSMLVQYRTIIWNNANFVNW